MNDFNILFIYNINKYILFELHNTIIYNMIIHNEKTIYLTTFIIRVYIII